MPATKPKPAADPVEAPAAGAASAAEPPTEAEQPVQRADARRNREAVLEAGRRLFAERGLDAQVDDIAAAAGIGVGTVYRHFPTKDDLLDSLTAQRFERLVEWAREAVGADDPWRAFCEFMWRSAQLQADDRALSELLASRPAAMHDAAVRSGLFELTGELVARAQGAGAMRADAVVEDVPTIVCGLGRVTQAASGESIMSWQRFLAILLDGLRPPGSAPLPPRDA